MEQTTGKRFIKDNTTVCRTSSARIKAEDFPIQKDGVFMFHKIKTITPKDNYILSAVFQDGTKKEYEAFVCRTSGI